MHLRGFISSAARFVPSVPRGDPGLFTRMQEPWIADKFAWSPGSQSLPRAARRQQSEPSIRSPSYPSEFSLPPSCPALNRFHRGLSATLWRCSRKQPSDSRRIRNSNDCRSAHAGRPYSETSFKTFLACGEVDQARGSAASSSGAAPAPAVQAWRRARAIRQSTPATPSRTIAGSMA